MKIDMEKVTTVVREAAKIFADKDAASNVEKKGRADFVTKVDFEVQQFIQKKLYEIYPKVQFMGEEKDNSDIDKSGQFWILDPVDGTTNLIHDYGQSAISLAMFDNHEPAVGIVYNPYRDEMFTAIKGEGAYLNGKRIYAATTDSISNSLVSIGTSPYYKEVAEEMFPVFKAVYGESLDIRRSGSAAIDLSSVACGRIDLYFEKKLKIWDYAAGMLLVREAGGVVVNFDGRDAGDDYMADIAAGSRKVVDELLEKYL
jgi:myo-inositol-1(or 4)-monophosphatase